MPESLASVKNLPRIRLGRTGLDVAPVAMGCLPIQRLSPDDAAALLRYACDCGVDFFDTAHVYTDSEEQMGAAVAGGLRERVIIASKAMSDSYEGTASQIDESLRRLKTDYVDLYQWHNPATLGDFQNERGPYQALLDAQKAGKIRFIGLTNHSLPLAREAIRSGAFDTLQYPLSVLSSVEEIEMTRECTAYDIGFIAMKAMCGGLVPDGRLPAAFMNEHRHIVPIWGIEKRAELDQFVQLALNPEPFTEKMREEIERLREEFGDEYCRGCGYCLPCPAKINLPLMMRIIFFVKRHPAGSHFTEKHRQQVAAISGCTECRGCVSRCPYHLEAPQILKKQQKEYARLYEEYLTQQ